MDIAAQLGRVRTPDFSLKSFTIDSVFYSVFLTLRNALQSNRSENLNLIWLGGSALLNST